MTQLCSTVGKLSKVRKIIAPLAPLAASSLMILLSISECTRKSLKVIDKPPVIERVMEGLNNADTKCDGEICINESTGVGKLQNEYFTIYVDSDTRQICLFAVQEPDALSAYVIFPNNIGSMMLSRVGSPGDDQKYWLTFRLPGADGILPAVTWVSDEVMEFVCGTPEAQND